MADRPLEIRFKGKLLRFGDIGKAIEELPARVRGKALLHVSEFFIKKFKLYPRYKYKSRKAAYPEVQGFFSDKQRRFVMAAIADGRIQPGLPHRTQTLKNSWKINKRDGELSKLSMVNDAPAAVFAYSPIYQARQLGLVGWEDTDTMIDNHKDEAFLDLEVFIFNEYPKEFDKQLKG